MKDRVPMYPGRVRLTPVAGQADTFDMVRADEPVEEGTPLNRRTMQLLQADRRVYPVADGESVKAGDVVDVQSDGTVSKILGNVPKFIPKTFGNRTIHSYVRNGTSDTSGILIFMEPDKPGIQACITMFDDETREFSLGDPTTIATSQEYAAPHEACYVGPGKFALLWGDVVNAQTENVAVSLIGFTTSGTFTVLSSVILDTRRNNSNWNFNCMQLQLFSETMLCASFSGLKHRIACVAVDDSTLSLNQNADLVSGSQHFLKTCVCGEARLFVRSDQESGLYSFNFAQKSYTKGQTTDSVQRCEMVYDRATNKVFCLNTFDARVQVFTITGDTTYTKGYAALSPNWQKIFPVSLEAVDGKIAVWYRKESEQYYFNLLNPVTLGAISSTRWEGNQQFDSLKKINDIDLILFQKSGQAYYTVSVYKNQIGNFENVATQAISLQSGGPGQNCEVIFDGVAELPGMTAGQRITSDGVQGYCPEDGRIWVKPEWSNTGMTGSYIGTGVGSKSDDVVSLEFPFTPRFISITEKSGGETVSGPLKQGDRISISTGSQNYLSFALSGNTVSFHSLYDARATYSFNELDQEYVYLAFY